VLPSPGDLFATGYGQTLLVKVVLVAAVAALGGWNRRTLAGGRPVPPRLGRIVSIELLGLLLVVAVTAVLVNRSPVEASATPTGPTVTVPAPDAVEVPLSSGAGTARYVLSPARTGQNQIELTLTDASGAPIEPVEVPTVDLTEPTLGVGPLRPIVHPIQPGLFHVIADIPIAGTYDMEIRVRTDEFTSVQAASQVVIAG
jgi:copper transport protein